MYVNNFVNCLSAAAASGNFSIQLQSLNCSPNITLTLVATGTTAGMAPDEMALNAVTQFNTILIQNSAEYLSPKFSSQVPQAAWRVICTDHIITFFSESQFRLTISDNDTGASLVATHDPLLVTYTDLDSLVALMNIGASLTEAQKLLLIQQVSGLIVSYTNNLIVQAGYVQSFVGYYQKSFFLTLGNPIQSFDMPRVAPPGLNFGYLWWDFVISLYQWNLNPITGQLDFMNSQNLLNIMEPSSLQNQIKISYVAGEYHIPAQVLLVAVQLIKAIINDPIGVKSLKTGSFSVSYKDRSGIQAALALLDSYRL